MWRIHFSWSLNHSHDLHAFNRKYVSFKPDALIDCLARQSSLLSFVSICMSSPIHNNFAIVMLQSKVLGEIGDETSPNLIKEQTPIQTYV